MANINIVRTEDCYNCDDCGYSYSDGAIVYVDGVEVLNLKPVAHCCSPVNYSDNDIYRKILEYFGHVVSDTETVVKNDE